MTNPTIVVLDRPEDVAAAVADHVARQVLAKPASTLGLATGNTFRPVYAALVARYQAGGLSFAQAASFNLDEYVGLPEGHPASFATYMHEHFFDHVDLPRDHALLPGVVGDVAASGVRYEHAIAARGGIDLQLLGMGRNGHIGFNEPGADFASRTRLVTLAPSTIEANTGDFPAGEVPPPTAITMGIGTIMDAREIVMVVLGAAKAETLRHALSQPPTTDLPASALQSHAHVTIYCDRPAAP